MIPDAVDNDSEVLNSAAETSKPVQSKPKEYLCKCLLKTVYIDSRAVPDVQKTFPGKITRRKMCM